jgi:hypothetical protein
VKDHVFKVKDLLIKAETDPDSRAKDLNFKAQDLLIKAETDPDFRVTDLLLEMDKNLLLKENLLVKEERESRLSKTRTVQKQECLLSSQ